LGGVCLDESKLPFVIFLTLILSAAAFGAYVVASEAKDLNGAGHWLLASTCWVAACAIFGTVFGLGEATIVSLVPALQTKHTYTLIAINIAIISYALTATLSAMHTPVPPVSFNLFG